VNLPAQITWNLASGSATPIPTSPPVVRTTTAVDVRGSLHAARYKPPSLFHTNHNVTPGTSNVLPKSVVPQWATTIPSPPPAFFIFMKAFVEFGAIVIFPPLDNSNFCVGLSVPIPTFPAL